jgi:hypothetical protein
MQKRPFDPADVSRLTAANDAAVDGTRAVSPPLPPSPSPLYLHLPFVGYPFAPPFMLPAYQRRVNVGRTYR